MSPRRVYVLAFLFTRDRQHVVLIHKNRPAWQRGRLNALGGKVAPDESPHTAARREVEEESGVRVTDWEEFLTWEDAEYRLHALRAFHDAASGARTAEDQEVELVRIDALPPNVIDNLRWLVPLALDRDVAVPVLVRSANPAGSGLTEATTAGDR